MTSSNDLPLKFRTNKKVEQQQELEDGTVEDTNRFVQLLTVTRWTIKRAPINETLQNLVSKLG
ncbi:5499_t:CDS:2 [Ambispora gerdemannii]|uniref:5499_t:CDS:1 n=1 Tax=Ambispora gerdemannii TaxID=144530 RepID=A0A9N9BDH8_9GLOM|nr:5499_t:CDS:2 [Ambispora gerdemannii]